MNKTSVYIFILCGLLLQSCNIYKRSFGETFTRLEIEQSKKVYRLNLSNQNLKEDQIKLDKLVRLRMLNLSGNRTLNLKKIFETIPEPEQLEVLILDSLNLKELPESIARFKNLKHLSLNFNPELNLKKSLASILSLPIQFLNLQQNNLTSLPPEIGNFKTLKALNLSHNRILDPHAFQFLEKLPKLRSLWLTHNDLSQLPKGIELLSSLSKLYIENNNLSALPISIKNLSNLTILHIGHNEFITLPVELINVPKLRLLHINNCNIIEIPENFSISKYSLMGIIIDNNKLSDNDKIKWRKQFSSFYLSSF